MRAQCISLLLISILLAGACHAEGLTIPDKYKDFTKNMDSLMKDRAKSVTIIEECLACAREYYKNPDKVGLRSDDKGNDAADDKYFSKSENVKASPAAAERYFSKAKNIKNLPPDKLEGAKEYFSTKNNIGKNVAASNEFLRKVNNGKSFDLDPAGDLKSLAYSKKLNALLIGADPVRSAILLAGLPDNAKIKALKDGFSINGDVISGFKLLSYDPAKKTYSADNYKVRFNSPNGQAVYDGKSVLISSQTELTTPKGYAKNLDPNDLRIYVDGKTKVDTLKTPAISISDQGMFANKLAKAELRNGPLSIIADRGSAFLKPLTKDALMNFDRFGMDLNPNGYKIEVQGNDQKGGKDKIQKFSVSTSAVKAIKELESGKIGTRSLQATQELLNIINREEIGAGSRQKLAANGKPTAQTTDEIKRFQQAHGIAATGIIDAETMSRMVQETSKTQVYENDVYKGNAGPARGSLKSTKTADEIKSELSSKHPSFDLSMPVSKLRAIKELGIPKDIPDSAVKEYLKRERMDVSATIPLKQAVSYYDQMSKKSPSIYLSSDDDLKSDYYKANPGAVKFAMEKRAEMFQKVPALVYQYAQEASQKYGVAIDPAKLVSLVLHESGNFESPVALLNSNVGGIRQKFDTEYELHDLSQYKAYPSIEEGVRGFVEHMYKSDYYYQEKRYTLNLISQNYCPCPEDKNCCGSMSHAVNVMKHYDRIKGTKPT